MGMFDYLYVRYPLEDPEHNKLEFQTKDLECTLSRYLIDEHGYLWLERCHYRFHMPGEEPDPRPLPPPVVEQVPFHGDLEFYNGRCQGDVLYMARFINGKLEKVVRAKDKSEHGFVYFEHSPFGELPARPTTLPVPTFPPLR